MSALEHPVTWAAPRPLWRGALAPAREPTILRFASDDFMEQLLGLLASDPAALGAHVARFETWRTPAAALATPDRVDRVPLPAPAKRARRGRLLGRAADPAPPSPAPARTLKLYQPASQRHYVVAATLACRVPGLPDRAPAGGHERVGFVLRRLLPRARPTAGGETDLAEFAFVKDAGGARWRLVADGDPAVLAPGEELLPSFPLALHDSAQVRRRIWGGTVPVGRREEYMAAPVTRAAVSLVKGQELALRAPAAAGTRSNSTIARMTEFKMDVAEPWKAMIARAQKAAADIAADPDDTDNAKVAGPARRQARLRAVNLQLQTQSWLILVDLAHYLARNLPSVHAAVKADSAARLTGYKLALFDWLGQALASADANGLRNGLRDFANAADTLPYLGDLRAALRAVVGDGDGKVEALLDAAETRYEASTDAAKKARWPSFHCLLAGVASDGLGAAASIAANGPFAFAAALGSASSPPLPDYPADEDPAGVLTPLPQDGAAGGFDMGLIDKVTALVARALDKNDERDARPVPFAQTLAASMAETAADAGLFVMRFVHLNEDCGPLHPPTLSEPTARVRLASFFDSDAPARPIRIVLPADTSPAGLRKHARGTAFVMSNMLCGQIQRVKGLGFVDLVLSVLPWPLNKKLDLGDGGGCKSGSVDIGMICSLSIPIITLCALILLIIFVFLFELIFSWLPFFFLCFPVPGLKGKPPAGGDA